MWTVFCVFFFMFTGVVFLNVILGIIVDTFGSKFQFFRVHLCKTNISQNIVIHVSPQHVVLTAAALYVL